MVRIIVALVLVVGGCLALPACNTTKGVGQDMQSGGQSVEKAADKNGASN